jgi:hypothetical protein
LLFGDINQRHTGDPFVSVIISSGELRWTPFVRQPEPLLKV